MYVYICIYNRVNTCWYYDIMRLRKFCPDEQQYNIINNTQPFPIYIVATNTIMNVLNMFKNPDHVTDVFSSECTYVVCT